MFGIRPTDNFDVTVLIASLFGFLVFSLVCRKMYFEELFSSAFK